MASGGGTSSPPSLLGPPPKSPVAPLNRSWAHVAGASRAPSTPEPSPLHHRDCFEKLKASIQDRFVTADGFRHSAQLRMQNSLFGKFLGRALPLEQMRMALNAAWKSRGSFSVADMANGFYFIRCDSQEMADNLVWDRPWSISGMVLQLIPWRPNFQPAFERLSSAAVWVQLHHLPMELWDADTLEDLAANIGRLVKIDELTLNESRAKFARLCIEIDLSKPLKTGLWVGPADDQALIVISYERLPTFCLSCGCVGHGSESCGTPSSSRVHLPSPPDQVASAALVQEESLMHLDEVGPVATDCSPQFPPPSDSGGSSSPSDMFGNWMVVQRRRGRGSGRSSSFRPRMQGQPSLEDTSAGSSDLGCHVAPPRFSASFRGRGGRTVGYPSSLNSFASHASKGHLHFNEASFPPFHPDDFATRGLDPTVPFPVAPDPPPLGESPFPSRSPFASAKGKEAVSTLTIPAVPLPPAPSSPPPLNPATVFPSGSIAGTKQLPSPRSSSPASNSPLLMSSLSGPSGRLPPGLDEMLVEDRAPYPDEHAVFVDRVALALCPSPQAAVPPDPGEIPAGVVPEPADLIESDSSGDLDDGKTLMAYQIEAKVLARREARKAKSGKHKGRASDPY